MNNTTKKSSNRPTLGCRQFLAASGSAVALGLIGAPGPVRAQSRYAGQKVVFASWGGAYQNAQKVSLCEACAKKTGALAVVSIRPERIALRAGDPPAGMENAIDGRITDVVYLGRLRKFVIRTRAGLEVVSLQQVRNGSEPGFELGAAVSLHWQADDATMLPDQAPS
jgi:ABC-type Fe3+/spermidine/putrescine transport system ATPase subunit